jgi:hypothetical protein
MTEDKCANCGKELIQCLNGHYICTRCTKHHPCKVGRTYGDNNKGRINVHNERVKAAKNNV